MSSLKEYAHRLASLAGRVILQTGLVGSGRAVGPLSFWFFWEWVCTRRNPPKPIRQDGIFLYCLETYHGPPVALADGTSITRGDKIAEIHFNNRRLTSLLLADGSANRSTRWTWVVGRILAQDLRHFASEGQLPREVKALHGITILGPGARWLGFQVRELPRTTKNDLTRFFMLGLMAIYNPEGKQRATLAERDAYPCEVWFGRRALEERYGGRESPQVQ